MNSPMQIIPRHPGGGLFFWTARRTKFSPNYLELSEIMPIYALEMY